MSLARSVTTWRFAAAAPPREVFAVMEQFVGTPPYRYEVVGPSQARCVEVERRNFFGFWKRPKRRIRWIDCRAVETGAGTDVIVEASKGQGPVTRGLGLVRILSRGMTDRRTIYRNRPIPPGPVTLVASWAGMPYRLHVAPEFDAPRGTEVFTATRIEAVGDSKGSFIKVRLADGTEGWIERDQVVPAPEVATRSAQEEVARFG